MSFSIQGWKGVALSLLASAVLVSCGGGDDDAPPVASVQTFGDSLADSGTFGGVRATIQGANSKVYPELVAAAYGQNSDCNYFVFDGSSFAPNPTAGCNNYAVGGGRINGASGGLSAADPRNVGVQLDAATAGGNFAADDLLLIVGGGNDAADLVGAFLAAQQGSPTGYLTILGQLLSPAEVAQATKSATDLGAAGSLYMAALADRMTDLIRTKALAKGAERVAVLNLPAITLTPRFQLVLMGVEMQAGRATRLQLEGLFNGLWIDAYNARLKKNFQGSSSVTVIDANAAFVAWVANPTAYGLTNVTNTACPATGVGSDGLPTYTFPTCTESALAAAPPAGATGANWFQSWLFSDGFHPSQKGHQLVTEVITSRLKAVGWL
jgi:phospholipase/lecithinase/hemolysin